MGEAAVRHRIVGALALLMSAAASLAGQTVTLTPIADTFMKEDSANRNFGTDASLVLQENGSRVLVQFDTSAIVAAVGSGSLASAQLQVYIGSNAANWGPTGRSVDIYRLDAAWTEGGATWNCGDDTQPKNDAADCPSLWSGGTTEPDASDTLVITSASTGWIQFDVTADVLAFLAGTANDGWLIRKTDEGQSGRVDLVSRAGAAGPGPRLVLLSESATNDTVPPSLTIVAPAQPVLVNVASPAITVTYRDGGSGVDTSTLQILLDGQDVTGSCTAGPQSATCSPPPLTAGTHSLVARIRDHAGNAASATFTFQLLIGPGAASLTLPVNADTFLTDAAPDREHGRAATLRVAKEGPSRALVSFDLSPLPAALAGGQLVAAQLELSIAANGNNWGSAGRPVGAYALTAPWSEPAATWDCPADTNLDNKSPDCPVPWNGGSFAANPTSTVLHTRNLGGAVAYDVTADVAAYLAGAANAGWLIKKVDESLSGRVDYTSREAATGTPAQLVVAFQVPPPLPTVVLTAPADGSYSRIPTVQVTGQVGGSATSLTVNGQAVVFAQSGTFTVPVPLSAGVNQIVGVAADAAGNQATAAVGVILDTTPPTITLSSPTAGTITNQSQVTVSGTALDDNGVASVTVGGQPVTLAGSQFSTTVQLVPGANSISVLATDVAGNTQAVTTSITQYAVPLVTITSPADLTYVNATTVTVGGTVTATGSATVTVNGVPATVAGSSFNAPGVPLIEGGNTLTATATDAQGHVAVASINVVRDLTPPHVAIYTPAPGATITATAVTVSGLVNDIVAGTVNAANVTVTVNGIPATVSNRSFVVPSVPLQPGANVLTAIAVDAAGNQAQATVTVRQATPVGPRIAVSAGNGQSAPIKTQVPQPLVAVLLDATGQPVAGSQVLFQALGTDGTFDNGLRSYVVTSDVAGLATVHFTVGSHAGAGNQLVQASAPGFNGPAQFVCSAQPGTPALIVVDSGDQQQGVAGAALPLPLVAVVVDAGANRLAGIAATLRVVKGAGTFANGQQTLALTTDSDGRLIASFTTDPAEGVANNVVEATIDALPASPVASFTASALAAFDPSQTTISGVVLDNSNQPLAGATIRILNTTLTAVTDGQGLLHLTGVPVGTLKLIVDGSTVQSPGSWPQLEFNLTTIPGRDNSVRMPIYLLPLDLANGIAVDETHGGRLTLPQIPGFALNILPGSVTFPGGGHSGTVSVTVVHSDKVPMVPNFGQQPRLIITIQPAGAQFSPPATLTMPNVEGLPAGRVTEFYSFDHDLGHFVSIGPGTVSNDGTTVTSNVGVGIVKAGWHCNGSPQAAGSPNACPDCTDCTGSNCANRTLCKNCNNTPGNACDGQGHCLTGRQLIQISQVAAGLGLNIGPKQSIGRTGDPEHLVSCPGSPLQSCFVAVREVLGPVTTSCDSISLKGAILTETESSVGFGCPGLDVRTGPGCIVTDGNQLVKLSGTGPCEDTHSICGAPPFPPPFPGPGDPPDTCLIVDTQTISLDGVTILTRHISYSITLTVSGCAVTVH
jgi:Glucodextranase, domain B/Carboxypeptidase regulatory-like domain